MINIDNIIKVGIAIESLKKIAKHIKKMVKTNEMEVETEKKYAKFLKSAIGTGDLETMIDAADMFGVKI